MRVTFGSIKKDRCVRAAPFRYTRLKCTVCDYDKELRHVTSLGIEALKKAGEENHEGLHCPRCGSPAELKKI